MMSPWVPNAHVVGIPWAVRGLSVDCTSASHGQSARTAHGHPMGLPWDAMEVPRAARGHAMGIPWTARGMTTDSQRTTHGHPIGSPWASHGQPMGIQWACHGLSMGIPWAVGEQSVCRPTNAYADPTNSPRASHRHAICSLWSVRGLLTGSPWASTVTMGTPRTVHGHPMVSS